MYIINKHKDLEGKTIAFSHMAQFAEQIVLATTDGGILMATFDLVDDEGSQEIRVFNKHRVMMILKDSRQDWLRNELAKLGIFNMEEYQEEERKKQQEEAARRKKEQEKREWDTYLRLKEKFEKAPVETP